MYTIALVKEKLNEFYEKQQKKKTLLTDSKKRN